ncbi:hypothetical protein OIT44_02710 [Weissella ceti]|uniref:Uncharacterized protein n=2 Tax=Weissella ceti TaxID=759620 RepID=A0ABT3E438_9LACO|nr:hypothetical protein [Weissella ceti]MCW0952982.1 hypothetical protein [Weissella ceti]
MMEEQQKEKLALPITGIVLGALGAILAFISGVRLLGLALAIIGLIVIVVAFVVNQKHKKVLTYVGLAVTIIAAILAMVLESNEPAPVSKETQSVAKALKAEDESIRAKKKSDDAKVAALNKVMTEEVLEKNAKMNIDNDASAWTKDYFDQLKVSKEITGVGGAKLADVEAVVGKPSLESDVDAEELKVRVVSWFSSTDDNDYLLIFVEQENGEWLLIDKSIQSDADTE